MTELLCLTCAVALTALMCSRADAIGEHAAFLDVLEAAHRRWFQSVFIKVFEDFFTSHEVTALLRRLLDTEAHCSHPEPRTWYRIMGGETVWDR